MNRCFYKIYTFGATPEDEKKIRTSILRTYPVQMFNNEQLGEHFTEWESMDKVMSSLSKKYPDVLFCVSYVFEDLADDHETSVYFGNGHKEEVEPEEVYSALSPKLFGEGLDRSSLPADCLCCGQITVTGEHSVITISPVFSEGELVLTIRDQQGFLYVPMHTGIEVADHLR